MARVPQLSAQTAPKTSTGVVDFLPAAEVEAVQTVLQFLYRKHGLLLGHIGRHLSLGKNTDLNAHIQRGKVPLCVRDELAALCGVENLEAFLALPAAEESERESVVVRLKTYGLIGKVMIRKSENHEYATSRDTYLDS
jgi:hypothetical protein